MTFKRSKEWWLAKALAEPDCIIAAGIPDEPPMLNLRGAIERLEKDVQRPGGFGSQLVSDAEAVVEKKDLRTVLEALRSSAPQEPDDDAEWLREQARLVRESGEDEAASERVAAHFERIATRLQAKAPDALEQIAEFLVEQRNEPWPGGTDATRLHYWRDKAIEGARRLRALRAPETGEG